MDEYALRRAVVVFLDSATPADAQVREHVMRRLAERRLPAHRSHRVLLAGIAAAVSLATVGTALAATGNFPIRLNLVPFWSDRGPLKEKQPAGASPQASPASVSIEYSYTGTTATVRETFDPSSAPLTVDAVDRGGPQSKTSEGLGPIDIETLNGSPYAVVRTTVNGPVQWLMWKTADGIVVTVEFDSPVSATTAFNFATDMA